MIGTLCNILDRIGNLTSATLTNICWLYLFSENISEGQNMSQFSFILFSKNFLHRIFPVVHFVFLITYSTRPLARANQLLDCISPSTTTYELIISNYESLTAWSYSYTPQVIHDISSKYQSFQFVNFRKLSSNTKLQLLTLEFIVISFVNRLWNLRDT